MKAFVTGGERGIGRAVADALTAGWQVAIGLRYDGPGVIRGDVGDDPGALVDEAAAALGGLDAFVACAVEPIRMPILELEADDFDRTMRINARPSA